jgi:formate dehydrogenase iron-sulfur subunit
MCLGCNACSVECKRNNNVPVGRQIAWTRIEEYENGVYPHSARYFLKFSCKHCTEASCMNVCPAGAISKPDAAHVVINQDRCIGCGYCAQACPFHVPHFGEPKTSSQKCMFCSSHGMVDGQTACAAACPFGAISFGERSELIAQGRERVAILRAKGNSEARLYGEHELGGMNVLYVLEQNPRVYRLPENPQVATKNLFGSWISGVASAGLVALLPFWLLIRRREKLAGEKGEK